MPTKLAAQALARPGVGRAREFGSSDRGFWPTFVGRRPMVNGAVCPRGLFDIFAASLDARGPAACPRMSQNVPSPPDELNGGAQLRPGERNEAKRSQTKPAPGAGKPSPRSANAVFIPIDSLAGDGTKPPTRRYPSVSSRRDWHLDASSLNYRACDSTASIPRTAMPLMTTRPMFDRAYS